MNHTLVVLTAVTVLIGSVVLQLTGQFTAEQVKVIWQLAGPVALGALGLQNQAVSTSVKTLNRQLSGKNNSQP